MPYDTTQVWQEIEDRKRALVEGPIYRLPTAVVEAAVRKIAARTPESAAYAERAASVIPSGVQHMLAIRDPYPLVMATARGARCTDVDGNEYIDYLMMAGPILLGHNHPDLVAKMIEVQQTEGIGMGFTSRWEIEASELICRHIESVEMVRYLQSGTEADIAAARLARAYTGRTKIIRVGGAYHGWGNEFVYDMHVPYSGAFEAHGIPPEYYAHVVAVPPNDPVALEEAFERNRGDVAAFFVEPAGPETGAILVRPDYLAVGRELCDRHGALLVFDEVVTGFRFAMGGAQAFYGVQADLTVLGKIITHGYPSSGALGGRRDIMERLADPAGKPFLAGTMAGNAVSAAATCFAIELIENTGAIERANAAAARLSTGLNEIFEAKGLPFFSYTTASLVHFETTAPLSVDIREPGGIEQALGRKAAVDQLATVLASEGVLTKYGARAFTSLAHDDATIDRTLAVFDAVVAHYRG